jgi:hypothetical protein
MPANLVAFALTHANRVIAVPNVTVQFLDTGHFALQIHVEVIAAARQGAHEPLPCSLCFWYFVPVKAAQAPAVISACISRDARQKADPKESAFVLFR